MGIDSNDYQHLIKKLFPRGRLWDFAPNSLMSKIVEAISIEFARFSLRVDDLLREVDPSKTNELLNEWEEFLGLPDPCSGPGDTTAERRSTALTRFLATGGQSRQYYIDDIKALGFDIEITEFRRFKAGSKAGLPVCNQPDWRHTWQVNTLQFIEFHFKAGSKAGEPLRIFKNELVQCRINRIKPAHTFVLYTFPGD